MSSKEWSQIEDLFNKALELKPEARPAFLKEISQTQPGLEKEIESLLKAHDKAQDFLETPGIEQVYSTKGKHAEEELIGETVGAYKIESSIGEGGMGVVYRAKRADGEFEKDAAIKFLKDSLGSEQLLKRFQNERQALASLSHPNIAKIIDAGNWQNKYPYFIMEYIDGMPIDQFCFQRKTGLIQTLELFLKVCSAVQYAHQNLIIHRDLKPSNLLVTKSGEPVLLDFGIAKILDQNIATHDRTLTSAHQKIFTPDFASPEQIKGYNITTATDIYSLGVNLFKILTGALPFKTAEKSTFEIEKIIVEEEPLKPSTALKETIASGKSDAFILSSSGNLLKVIAGDLDNIILKALRKEPSERYSSVEQFTGDIRNFLDGRPVLASKSTFKYRSSKFIQRNKAAVFFTTLLLFSMITGIIGTSWQARIAEQQRRKAVQSYEEIRRLSNALIFDVHDAIKDIPGSTTARKLVMANALEYLDKLSKEESDPTLMLELAQAYEKIGDVLGNPTNANLGDVEGATQSYEKARKLMDTAQMQRGSSSEILARLASINKNLGDVYTRSGKLETAILHFKQALDYYKKNAAPDSSDIRKQKQLAIGYIKYGDVLGNKHFPNLGRIDDARMNYENSLKIWNRLIKSHPDDQANIRFLGLTHERLGTIHEQKKELKTAESYFKRSLELRKELVDRFSKTYNAQRDLAIGYENMAMIHELEGNIETAINYQTQALRIHDDLLASDPENIQAVSTIAIVLERLSRLNLATGNKKAAQNYTNRFLDMVQELAEKPTSGVNEFNMYSYYAATCLPAEQRRPNDALKYALKAKHATNGTDPNILDTVAMAYFVNGEIDKAIATQEKALSLLDKNSPNRGEIESNMKKFRATKQKKAGK